MTTRFIHFILSQATQQDIRLEGFSGRWGNTVHLERLQIGRDIELVDLDIDWSLLKSIATLGPWINRIELKNLNYQSPQVVSQNQKSSPFTLNSVYQAMDAMIVFSWPELHVEKVQIDKQKIPFGINCNSRESKYVCQHEQAYRLQIDPAKHELDFNYKLAIPNRFRTQGQWHYSKNALEGSGRFDDVKTETLTQPLQLIYGIKAQSYHIEGDIQAGVNNEQVQVIMKSRNAHLLDVNIQLPAAALASVKGVAAYEPRGEVRCSLVVDIQKGDLKSALCKQPSIKVLHEAIGSAQIMSDVIQLDKQQLTLDNLRVLQKKHQSIQGHASVNLKKLSGVVSIMIDKLSLYLLKEYRIRVNGQIEGQLSPQQLAIRGQIQLADFNKKSQKFFSSNIPTIETETLQRQPKKTAPPFPVNYDLHIGATQALHLKDKGVSLFVSPDLNVAGMNENLSVTGSIQLERGTIELLNQQFSVMNSQILLSNNQTTMKILLVTRYEEYDMNIQVTGTSEKPSIRLFSKPSLPPNEILARLLFSSGFDELSPMQVVQLLKVLDDFSRGGSQKQLPDFTESLKHLLNLDGLVLGHLPGRSYGVGIVKHLNSRTTVGVNQSLDAAAPEASIKVKISKRLELEGRSGSADNPSRIELKWKRDF